MAEPDVTTPVERPAGLDSLEWLPAGDGAGVLRIRGPRRGAAEAAAPVLVLAGGSTPIEPLPAPSPRRDGWRCLYLLESPPPAADGWAALAWPDGHRLELPGFAGAEELGAPAPAAPETVASLESEGQSDAPGRVVDRAVLAERRARRAEEAGRRDAQSAAQARRAVAALAARLDQLAGEREALDARLAAARAVAAAPPATGSPAVAAPVHGDLSSELARARAAAHAAELRAAEREASLGRTREALARLKRQVADLRSRMRAQAASHAADSVRLAVLEHERAQARPRETAAREELERLRAEVSAMQDARRREQAEVDALRADRARVEAQVRELRSDLAEQEHRAQAAEEAADAARRDMDAARADASELSAHARAAEAGRIRAEAQAERLADALAAARTGAARSAAELAASRGAERAARADAAAGRLETASLRRELAERDARLHGLSDRLAAADARGDSLQAALDAERAARRAQDARVAELESQVRRVERRSGPEAAGDPVESDPGGLQEAAEDEVPGLQARIAELERRRRTREELVALFDATARFPRGRGRAAGENETSGLAARLDAAAASLRAAAAEEGEVSADGEQAIALTPAAPASAPSATGAPAPPVDPEAASPEARAADRASSTGAQARPPEARAAALPAVAPARAARSAAVATRLPAAVVQIAPGRAAAMPAAPPSRADADVQHRRAAPLRQALLGLAREDPFAAARLLAGVLPAQGAFLDTDIDYDLTIRELGTFAVTVASKSTQVRVLSTPRSRRVAELHLSASSLVLAELLLGRPRRVGRLLAPVRLRGPRRRLAALGALAEARPTLAEVARAGARLEPGLLLRALPHAIDPAWCAGREFSVLQEIAGEVPQRWLVACTGHRLVVRPARADTPADAHVSLSRECFERLVRGERPLREDLPRVRGDRGAVEALRSWMERVRA